MIRAAPKDQPRPRGAQRVIPFHLRELAGLVVDPSAAESVPRERVPALLAGLEEVRSGLLVRLLTPVVSPTPVEQPDQMLTVAEVADRLAVDVRWVYEHTDTDLASCSRRIGARTLRFSSRALDRWLEAR